MLIDFVEVVKRRQLKITGIIQAGAHFAEEYESYRSLGVRNFVFVEPCKKAFAVMADKFSKIKHDPNNDSIVAEYNKALADYYGKATMRVERRNNGQSNSLLNPKLHLNFYPDITFDETEEVTVMRMDQMDIDFSFFNTLVMDTQGSELRILKGAGDKLRHFDIVYSEVNTAELYEGCAQLNEMDEFLSDFDRVETVMTNQFWGDAVWIRKTINQ